MQIGGFAAKKGAMMNFKGEAQMNETKFDGTGSIYAKYSDGGLLIMPNVTRSYTGSV